jgi:hypothetical protein
MRTRARFLALLGLVLLPLSLFRVSTPVIAADSPLVGTWQHQRDSGGWKVVAGGSVTMRLDRNRRALLTAIAPNQAPMEVAGTWSEQGGRVTLNIPNQFELANQPYKLQGDTLTLPSQLSEDKPGTSTWVRVPSEGMDLVFVAFNRALEEGKGGATAAEEAAKEARKQEGVEQVEVIRGGIGLVITVAPGGGAGRSKGVVWFASKPAPFETPVQRKPVASPLAGDPRTHIDAQNSAGDPDAPRARTALVVAPFQSQSYYSYARAVFKEGDADKARSPAQFAKTTTFDQNGEDPAWLAKELEKAGYGVTLLMNDKATPGAIFRALQTRPSIIYFASHGGVMGTDEDLNGVASAGFLGAKSQAKRPGFMTAPIARQRLKELLDAEGVPEAARAGVTWACMEWKNGFAFAFPILLPRFFEEALGKDGISDGFVFIDACYSAHYPVMARAFKARAFVGYNDTIAGWASARYSRYIFSNLIHKGHSVREATDRLRNLCNGAYVVWLEDSILSPVARGDVDLKEEAKYVEAWGSDLKPYDRVSNEAFWLMRMARWAHKDVNEGASTLERCYGQFWRPPSRRPGLADQFCNSGILGSHTPTQPEVDDARHLVSGKPSKPGGRFVIR